MLWVGIALAGLALGLLNVRGTSRIWRSGVYERGQCVAQTALIWIIPGAVFVVLQILESDRRGRELDPTATNSETPNVAVTMAGPGTP